MVVRYVLAHLDFISFPWALFEHLLDTKQFRDKELTKTLVALLKELLVQRE